MTKIMTLAAPIERWAALVQHVASADPPPDSEVGALIYEITHYLGKAQS